MFLLFLIWHNDTCQFFKVSDVAFRHFLDGGAISVFNYKQDTICDTK
jgi:hypothetical protein